MRRAFFVLVALIIASDAQPASVSSNPDYCSVQTGVPSELLIGAYPVAKRGLFMVQLQGPAPLGWGEVLQNAGAHFVDHQPGEAYLVTSTPEQIATIRALPYVRCAEIYQPFRKSDSRMTFNAAVRYDVYINVPAADFDDALAELQRYGAPVSIDRSQGFQGFVEVRFHSEDDALAIRRDPLVIGMRSAHVSHPIPISVWPRRAAPGTWVTISADFNFQEQAVTMRLNGISAETKAIDRSRVRMRVPANAAPGPAELLFHSPPNEQVLDADSPMTLTVDATTTRTQFVPGDVVVSYGVPCRDFEGMCGAHIRWLDADGNVIEQIGGQNYQTAAFDSKNRLNVFDIDGPTVRYDAQALPIESVPSDVFPNAVVFDGDDLLALEGRRIRRYAVDGSVLAELAVTPYPQRIDLAADRCTLFFTTELKVSAVDLCTRQQLPDVYSGSGIGAVRVAPNGTLYVSTATQLLNMTTTGSIIDAIPLDHFDGGMAFTPDGKTLWIQARDRPALLRLNIETHETTTIDAPDLFYAGSGWNGSIAVSDGWFAARRIGRQRAVRR